MTTSNPVLSTSSETKVTITHLGCVVKNWFERDRQQGLVNEMIELSMVTEVGTGTGTGTVTTNPSSSLYDRLTIAPDRVSMGKLWGHGMHRQRGKASSTDVLFLTASAAIAMLFIATAFRYRNIKESIESCKSTETTIVTESMTPPIEAQVYVLPPSCSTDTDCVEKFKF